VRVNGIPYYPVSAYHSSALCNVGRSSCRAGVVAYQSSAVVVNMSAAGKKLSLALSLATEMVFLILNDHRPRQTTIGTGDRENIHPR
jgi:hypothetical protein